MIETVFDFILKHLVLMPSDSGPFAFLIPFYYMFTTPFASWFFVLLCAAITRSARSRFGKAFSCLFWKIAFFLFIGGYAVSFLVFASVITMMAFSCGGGDIFGGENALAYYGTHFMIGYFIIIFTVVYVAQHLFRIAKSEYRQRRKEGA